MARNKGTFNFAANFQVKMQEALDPRVSVSTKEALITKETWPYDGDTLYLYEGLSVSVVSEQSIYILTDITKALSTDYSGWVKVNAAEIIDNVTSTNTAAALSANQGKVLMDEINNVKEKIASIYHVKGSVATYATLPTTKEVGDVYNVDEAYEGHPAGTNYVWTGEKWDALGGSIDLSNYYTKEEVDAAIKVETDRATKAESDINNILNTVKGAAEQALTLSNTQDTKINTLETNVSTINNKLDNEVLTKLDDCALKTEIPDISGKQDTLVSGTNIKTINGVSILGSGNIAIEGGNGEITMEVDPIFSKSPASTITENNISEWNNKVDKVEGKQLSTEDFTTTLKTKLDGLSNYDDTTISEAIESLRTDFDTLVSGDTTTAIKTFNEIIAFLEGIEDSESLDSIIASIEQQIAEKYTKPSVGIPKSDLDNDVQTSLNNADTAVQGFNDETSAYAKVTTTKNDDNSYDINVTVTTKNIADATAQTQGVADAYDVKTYVEGVVSKKQETLSSGTNIKTINGESILGSGDLQIGTYITDFSRIDLENLFNEEISEVPVNATALAQAIKDNKVITIPEIIGDEFVYGNYIAQATVEDVIYLTLPQGNVCYWVYIDLGATSFTRVEKDIIQNKLVSGINIKTINGKSVLASGDIVINADTITVDGGDTLNTAIFDLYNKAQDNHNAANRKLPLSGGSMDDNTQVSFKYIEEVDTFKTIISGTGLSSSLNDTTRISIDPLTGIQYTNEDNSIDITPEQIKISDSAQISTDADNYLSIQLSEGIRLDNDIEMGSTADIYLNGGGCYYKNLEGGQTLITGISIKNVTLEEDSTKTIDMYPNILYNVVGDVVSLQLNLVSIEMEAFLGEYLCQFTTSTDATLAVPETVQWVGGTPIIGPGTYQISILNNIGLIVKL